MKKILFITWDGPQTNYMEGLFMPIFNEIQQQSQYRFHIIQFTWADETQINHIKIAADNFGIAYSKKTIVRKPNATLGSLITVFKSVHFLKKYIRKHNIDIVMPRSTMPAMMLNRLKTQNFKLLFDADGFPLEERVDFASLSKVSKQYQFLKKEETLILNKADGVITRSEKASAIHLQTLTNKKPEKFNVVFNGRNADFFKPNAAMKKDTRAALAIPDDAIVFVYCGSLGAQYGWDEMIAVFTNYHDLNENSYFIILTGNPEFAQERIPPGLQEFLIITKIPFLDVPKYLAIADFAFAIREPKWSMQGVAPIKLGEYLLMGIPTIASAGIGDTDKILNTIDSCFLFRHDDNDNISKALQFIEYKKIAVNENIRNAAMHYFSLDESAKSYIKALDKLK
ncbi:MAG: hypothetical protein PSV16_10830 [Flavobacterium sp.]|nr:hypothetical protein [Flavobacterium sp.]